MASAAEQLSMHKSLNASTRRISKEMQAELKEDLVDLQKKYQGRLMKMGEFKEQRLKQTKAIKAIREQVKEMEGAMNFIRTKLGMKVDDQRNG